jgi:hypothetical protein
MEKNPALFTGVSLVGLLIILAVLMLCVLKPKYVKNINNLIYMDGLIFDRTKYNIDGYFKRDVLGEQRELNKLTQNNNLDNQPQKEVQNQHNHNQYPSNAHQYGNPQGNPRNNNNNNFNDNGNDINVINERNRNNNNEVGNLGNRNDVNTSRPFNRADPMDNIDGFDVAGSGDNYNNGQRLQLKENKYNNDNVIVKNNNYLDNTMENSKNGDVIDEDSQNNVIPPENLPTPFYGLPITIHDYESLSSAEKLRYDKRPFGTYIKDEIFRRHILVSLIMKTSILDPPIVRVVKLVYYFNIVLSFNALFYTDDYIEWHAISTNKVKFI